VAWEVGLFKAGKSPAFGQHEFPKLETRWIYPAIILAIFFNPKIKFNRANQIWIQGKGQLYSLRHQLVSQVFYKNYPGKTYVPIIYYQTAFPIYHIRHFLLEPPLHFPVERCVSRQ
jgi:hypothetical protein